MIDYTVCSTDSNRYSRINCNLTSPITKYAAMTITCLTTNCNIVVLEKDDYMMIDNVKYSLHDDYTNLNTDAFITLLNQMFNNYSLENNIPKLSAQFDNASRLIISSSRPFVINDMTYNFKLLTGFYNTVFPIKCDDKYSADEYFICANSVGFMLSTPILYLTSNVGMQSYRNMSSEQSVIDSDITGAKIVLRLNNSFSSGYPIISNNGDFQTTLLSNDLAMLEFILVDAFMHEIKLLSPMYLSIQVRSVPDEDVVSEFQLLNTTNDSPEARPS